MFLTSVTESGVTVSDLGLVGNSSFQLVDSDTLMDCSPFVLEDLSLRLKQQFLNVCYCEEIWPLRVISQIPRAAL